MRVCKVVCGVAVKDSACCACVYVCTIIISPYLLSWLYLKGVCVHVHVRVQCLLFLRVRLRICFNRFPFSVLC